MPRGNARDGGKLGLWEQHTSSYVPEVMVNEAHPRSIAIVLFSSLAILLIMYLVPAVRQYTGFDHPLRPIVLLLVAASVTFVQWRFWENRGLRNVLILLDASLYCCAVVVVAIDTTSPVRYVWALLYAQMAAHYGNRFSFGIPMLISVGVIPFGLSLLAWPDFGLLALTLFGVVMHCIVASTTARSRAVEKEKERYKAAYHLTDRVASESLDIALATTMAEVGNFLHEIRNASTPVVGNIMFLKSEKGLSEDARSAVSSLEQSNARINELMEKLLDRIKGRSVVRATSFELGDVIDPGVLGDGLAHADRRKVQIQGEVPGFRLQGDPEHLKAALENLLVNAVRAGARRVIVRPSFDGGLKRAVIRVEDDGPGIPPEKVETMFHPEAGSARGGGHGLGLPLSKRLVEVLGGELRLASTSEEGAVFEIVVPGIHSRTSGPPRKEAG